MWAGPRAAPRTTVAGGRDRPDRTDRGWALSAAGLAVVGLAVALFLAVRTRHEWFFVDEWDFLTTRVGPHPPTGLLVPHNEHPSMLPILVWRAVFAVFGMRHYAPYMAVLIVAHLAVVATVWAVSRRCGAGPGACLVAAAVMATAGVGWENMIWAFQIGMVASLLASWAGAVLTDAPRDRFGAGRLVLTWLVLAAGLACSAVSVPLLLLPALVTAARRGIRAALVVVGVPAVLFVAWYAGWGRLGVRQAHGFVPLQLPGYVIEGLSSALDGLTGLTGTSVAVLVAVLAAVRSGTIGPRAALTAGAGLVGVVAMYAFISLGRASLGDAQAQASRYAYLTAALVLPAGAVGLQRFLDRGAQRTAALSRVAVAGCAVLVCGHGMGLLEANIDSRLAMARVTVPQAAAAEVLAGAGAPLLAGVGPDRYSADLDGAGVLRLHRLGALRGLPVPTPAVLATSRLAFQTRLAPRTTRALLEAGATPPAATVVEEYSGVGQDRSPDPRPTEVVPTAEPGPPTVLLGRRVAVPAGIPASLDCVSTAPTDRPAVVRIAVGSGARAVLLLVEDAATVEYGWSASGSPQASATLAVGRDTVEQLTTLTGGGSLQVTSDHTLSVCPVR